MPAFNEERSIAAVLDHLLAQREVEVIVVVNNASTDATAPVVAPYATFDD